LCPVCPVAGSVLARVFSGRPHAAVKTGSDSLDHCGSLPSEGITDRKECRQEAGCPSAWTADRTGSDPGLAAGPESCGRESAEPGTGERACPPRRRCRALAPEREAEGSDHSELRRGPEDDQRLGAAAVPSDVGEIKPDRQGLELTGRPRPGPVGEPELRPEQRWCLHSRVARAQRPGGQFDLRAAAAIPHHGVVTSAQRAGFAAGSRPAAGYGRPVTSSLPESEHFS